MQAQPVIVTDATCTSMSPTPLDQEKEKKTKKRKEKKRLKDGLDATTYSESEPRGGCSGCALALGSTTRVFVVPCQGQW